MTLRRGHVAALRGLLTMPAIFSCFMLLLAPLAGTVEGATITAQVPGQSANIPGSLRYHHYARAVVDHHGDRDCLL